jgi:hypothetical protein
MKNASVANELAKESSNPISPIIEAVLNIFFGSISLFFARILYFYIFIEKYMIHEEVKKLYFCSALTLLLVLTFLLVFVLPRKLRIRDYRFNLSFLIAVAVSSAVLIFYWLQVEALLNEIGDDASRFRSNFIIYFFFNSLIVIAINRIINRVNMELKSRKNQYN